MTLLRPFARVATVLGGALAIAGCGEKARLPITATSGAHPAIAAPHTSLLPTMNIATAVGWRTGAAPTPAPGLAVEAFATGLDHPRWIATMPNGDVLVAETNAPPKPDDAKGIRGWVQRLIMKRAGSSGASANRITLLRDTDGDGKADVRSVLIGGLNSPFGMALSGGQLYIADTDAVLRVPYTPGQTRIDAKPVRVVALPAGTINHHWTKNLIVTPDGSKLYVTVGSNSNVGENGAAAEVGRAAIWEVDTRTGEHRIYAGGIRNPNGLGFEPSTGALWTVANERDELGSDLVPDYLTRVQFGSFYGWPWAYWGEHPDSRPKFPRPFEASDVTVPDYAMGPHVAALGLSFAAGAALGPRFANGAFVGEHGSWNRSPRSGYKVVFVPFARGMPAKQPIDVLTGFLDAKGEAQGRPVGVAIDGTGALLVADDVGNSIWRVTAPAPGARAAGATPRG